MRDGVSIASGAPRRATRLASAPVRAGSEKCSKLSRHMTAANDASLNGSASACAMTCRYGACAARCANRPVSLHSRSTVTTRRPTAASASATPPLPDARSRINPSPAPARSRIVRHRRPSSNRPRANVSARSLSCRADSYACANSTSRGVPATGASSHGSRGRGMTRRIARRSRSSIARDSTDVQSADA